MDDDKIELLEIEDTPKKKTSIKYSKKLKRKIIGMFLLLMIGIVTLLGTSYAIFTRELKGEKKVYIYAGNFKTTFLEGEYLTLKNISTMSQKEVTDLKPYEFSVANEGEIDAYYQVALTEEGVVNNTAMVDKKYLGYSLTGTDGTSLSGTLDELGNSMILIRKKYLKAGQTVNYSFKVWLTEDAGNSEMGKTYQSKVSVAAIQTTNTLADALVRKANQEGTSYQAGNQKEMFTFNQSATSLTSRLIDYRYIGEHPSNYITFAGDTWRIIGVFATGQGESYDPQVKLVKEDGIDAAYGNQNTMPLYVQDSSYYLYYKEKYQKMISPYPAYIGSVQKESSANSIYMQERTTKNKTNAYIQLLSLSDYVFTFANNYNRGCFDNITTCNATSWMSIDKDEALYSPIVGTQDQYFVKTQAGAITNKNIQDTIYQRQVIYLNPGVTLLSGDGTKSNPYKIDNE